MESNKDAISNDSEIINDEFERIVELLNNENALVRVKAVRFLGNSNDPRSVKYLIDVIREDREWKVQEAAAEELERYKDTRGIDPLIQSLKNPNKFVREAAIQSIGADARAVKPLIDIIEQSADKWSRWQAIIALGNIPEPQAIEALTRTCKDFDPQIRRAAVQALGNAGNTESIPSLIEMLKDKDEIVRKTSAEALGKFRDTRTYEPLMDRLGGDEISSVVRKAARNALLNMSKDIIKPTIYELMESNDGIKRNNLKEILRYQFRNYISYNELFLKKKIEAAEESNNFNIIPPNEENEAIKEEKSPYSIEITDEKHQINDDEDIKTIESPQPPAPPIIKKEEVAEGEKKTDQLVDNKIKKITLDGTEKKPRENALHENILADEGSIKEEPNEKSADNKPENTPKDQLDDANSSINDVKPKKEKVKKIATIKKIREEEALVTQLERLSLLKKKGFISEEEFTKAKEKLLWD